MVNDRTPDLVCTAVDIVIEIISMLSFQYQDGMNQSVVWFTKCNVKGNGNGLHSITDGNKFE
jgi:hypothetical protein